MDFAKLLTKFDSISSPAESLDEAWPGTAEWKKKQPGFNPYDPEGKEKEKLKLKPYGYRGPSGSDSDDEPKSSKSEKSSKKDKKPKKVKESNEVNEDDVEEGNDPDSQKFGRAINKYFGEIYAYGDDGLDYLDRYAPFWLKLFNKHDGDIDTIIANEPATVLKKAALELRQIANDLPYELGEASVGEGNEFSGELAKAKAQGKTEFEVGGKTYKVKESLEFDNELDEADDKDDKKDQEAGSKDDKESPDDSGDVKDTEKTDDEGKSGRTDDDLVMYRYLLGSGANFALIKAFLDHVDRGEAIPGPMVKEYSPVIKMIDNIVKSGPSAINYIRMAQNFVGNAKPETVSESKELEECYDQAMSSMSTEQQTGLNVNSSLDTKTGNQSLTVTAQGQAADQLAQLLKLSGILNVTQMSDGMSMDVDMGEDYANEPDPVIQSITPQLKQGNDMHRSKKTYPKVNGGDNPMQRIAEDQQVDTIEQRLNKLMEELSTIKVFKDQK